MYCVHVEFTNTCGRVQPNGRQGKEKTADFQKHYSAKYTFVQGEPRVRHSPCLWPPQSSRWRSYTRIIYHSVYAFYSMRSDDTRTLHEVYSSTALARPDVKWLIRKKRSISQHYQASTQMFLLLNPPGHTSLLKRVMTNTVFLSPVQFLFVIIHDS